MITAVSEAIEILERTPACLAALLAGLPAHWSARDEGEDTWSPFDVVGHLIHGEQTDWIPRMQLILETGEALPFPPFDRFAQERASAGRTLESLLEEFSEIRRENLDALRAAELSEADLERRGTHPSFGAVTLAQLLSTWVVHDLGHIAQITRAMASRYAQQVGPWRAYLPVLGD